MKNLRARALLSVALALSAGYAFARPQSAPGAGSRPPKPKLTTLTVQVLVGNDRSGFTVGGGAVVTLVGSSTNCSGRAIGVCDSSGRAVFRNVRGPFTVTAQCDVIDEGRTIRLAQTLFQLSPPTPTIVVPIFTDDDQPEGSLSASLSGTVANVPPLAGSLRVDLSTRAGGSDFNLYADVVLDDEDPSIGTYSMRAPPGEILDFALVEQDASGMPASAKLRLGYGPYFGSATQDFDYAPGTAIPFAHTPATYLNLLTGVDEQFASLQLRGQGGEDVEINLFQGFPGILPASLAVPPLSHSGMLGLSPSVVVEQYLSTVDAGGSCTESLDVTTYAFDLLGWPVIALPSPLSTAAAQSLTVSFVEGPGAQAKPDGINVIDLSSEDPGIPEVDAVVWGLLVRPGVTSVSIPPTALPMIGPGASLELSLGLERYDLPVDFDSLFSASFATELTQLFGAIRSACCVYDIESLDVVDDVVLVPLSLLRVTGPLTSGIPSLRTSGEESTLEALGLALDRLNEVYEQAGVRFIADPESLLDARQTIAIPASAVDTNGWIEAFPCGPCQPRPHPGCGELKRVLDFLEPFVRPGRVVLAPVGSMRFSRRLPSGYEEKPIFGATGLTGCTSYHPCGPIPSPVGCVATGAPAFLSLVGDDADGLVFSHEVGHQFGLCHCDDVVGLNLMVSYELATSYGLCTVPEGLCSPSSCPLLVLNAFQTNLIRTTAETF